VFRAGWFSATVMKGAGNMRVGNTNQRTMAILGTLALISMLAAQPLSTVASANPLPPIFPSAGGPYTGTVGEPITFDGSLSTFSDGNDVDMICCWDWLMENQFECIGGYPVLDHTYHCAYNGKVRVYVYDGKGNVDWDEAYVKVTGPETALCVTLQGDADLHAYDFHKQHVGLDYDLNGPEKDIKGATWCITDAAGKTMSLISCTPDAGITQKIQFPLYSGQPYGLAMVGVRDGTFDLTVQGYQDGAMVTEQNYSAGIFAGEAIMVSSQACCENGALSVDCGPLVYCPKIKVTPDKIKLTVDSVGGVYEMKLTISETGGLRPLRSVSLRCGDIKSQVHKIKGSDVTFDLNGFDIAPGGEQTVVVSFPVPYQFTGTATGTLSVDTADKVGKSIPVTVKEETIAPLCDPGGPYKGKVGKAITFNAGGSYDPDGVIKQFCWDWDWDGEFECTSSATIKHVWEAVFKGTVLLRVVDDDGQSAEKAVLVTVEEAD
jgi:hypothetical protein